MELTLESAQNDMLTVYQREKVILPYTRAKNPFLESMREDMEGMKPIGNVLEFNLRSRDGFGLGTPNDGADWAAPRRHQSIKAQVTRAQIEAALSITLEANLAGEGEGSFTGDPLSDSVQNCVRVFAIYKNALYLGHGTGRLAVVAADANATDTVVFDGPEFCFGLRPGMYLEFANLDTGGAIQTIAAGPIIEARIDAINLLTHTVTFEINITVQSNWGAYISGTYGKRKPNGMRNIIDDGALTDDIFNIVRADHPEVNATILSNGGQLQDYSEELVRDLLVQITQKTDMQPTVFWCNEGIRSEHYRSTTPDRVFQVVGKGDTPGYNIGANEEDLAMHYGGKKIPFKVDRSMVARSLYALYQPGWRKHTLLNDDWMKGGGAAGNSILHYAPAAGGGTYSNTFVGSLQGNGNCSHKHLNAQGAITNIKDRHSARD